MIKDKSRLVPKSPRNSRSELIRRGWAMRGAWAEKRIGNVKLVLSGDFFIEGVSYIKLSFQDL
jgi:hypothetical protein